MWEWVGEDRVVEEEKKDRGWLEQKEKKEV